MDIEEPKKDEQMQDQPIREKKSKKNKKSKKKDKKDKKEKKKSKKAQKQAKSLEKNSKSEEKKEKQEDQKKLYLPIHLYFFSEMINYLVNDKQDYLKEIQSKTDVQKIYIDKRIHLTDLGGKVITIFDKNRHKKEKALDLVLNEYERFSKDTPHFNPSRTSLIILIPEAVVSLFIGYKGSQINKLMDIHGTKIVVNQPIQNISFRTVEIKGSARDVRQTCKECYSSLQEVARDKNIRHLDVKPRTPSLRYSRSLAKLVIHTQTAEYLDRSKEKVLSQIEQEFGVRISIYSNYKLRFLKTVEKILQIEGKLEHVQKSLTKVIKSINDYANESMSFNFERMMLVIPSIYITKLIGAGGCMIREIAARSGGAQIKILSNRETERDHRVRECPVSIAGSLVNKQDAACLVLEQIESFKNGGPVLMSGKVLGKNIATQYKHSIQAQEGYDPMLKKRSSEKYQEGGKWRVTGR